ncbi:DUF1538 domain-containing protein [Fundicoccus culcitae]|uniref:DUF1538 domain-containing protein n=1 Tax=Fundicoccus culcitae TaxID=2969821 RepID=A0ABY5P7L2_9LACT|nr:DUF1538 domain-containing protein [Fundicoccus culcitae]UUX34701.1 DUF1538 domain-containing protein [Fundicoccus culcitae]
MFFWRGVFYLNRLVENFKETSTSVLPMVGVILLVQISLQPVSWLSILRFVIGVIFLLIGMPLFLVGVDMSVEKMGDMFSHYFISHDSKLIAVLGIFGLGFISSIAEPDLTILGTQVDTMTLGAITQEVFVVAVSAGVGGMLAFGVYRILRDLNLRHSFTIIYSLIGVLCLFSTSEFIAIAFDASGSTTGSITVPFILAFGAGAASQSREEGDTGADSFGLLGIVSTGAIFAVILYGVLAGVDSLATDVETVRVVVDHSSILMDFITGIGSSFFDSLIAISPLVIIFLVLVFTKQIKVQKRRLQNMMLGVGLIIVGLSLFLTGVNQGFLDVANEIGYNLAEQYSSWVIYLIGGIIGMVSILAEPSVHVLNDQILDETAGMIPKGLITISLSLGVGLSVVLSLLRVMIPALEIWHILLPLVVVAIVLQYFSSDLFVGIAFDSGGVAAGTMTATFILPFTQGVATYVPTANVITDGFGVIAIVSLTPIVVLQCVGIFYDYQVRNN